MCPVWLQGRKDWIHAPVEAPCVCVGGRGLHPFCFGVRLFNPPSPHPDFFSYLGLVLSPSRLRTLMCRNSSLESQAFVMRTFTGNRLLLMEGSGVMIGRSDSKEDAGTKKNQWGADRERGQRNSFLLPFIRFFALRSPFRNTLYYDSEDDYRTGCRNVSHCQQQQSYSGLHSPGRSNSTYFWNDSWVQTFHTLHYIWTSETN